MMRDLTADERFALVVGVQSTFIRLRHVGERVGPIYSLFGFEARSPGALAREFSEQIERGIVQHCPTFQPGEGFDDLQRHGERWEVKTGADGLTINQSAQVNGEHYIVINYDREAWRLLRIWLLLDARDEFFAPRSPKLNLRKLLNGIPDAHLIVLFGSEQKSLVP